MCKLDCTPEEIADVVRLRAERRMKGQTQEILRRITIYTGVGDLGNEVGRDIKKIQPRALYPDIRR
jgi:hypothetical protein